MLLLPRRTAQPRSSSKDKERLGTRREQHSGGFVGVLIHVRVHDASFLETVLNVERLFCDNHGCD